MVQNHTQCKDGRLVSRRVYRLGCYVRLVNKTNDTTVILTPEQEQRWRARLMRQNP